MSKDDENKVISNIRKTTDKMDMPIDADTIRKRVAKEEAAKKICCHTLYTSIIGKCPDYSEKCNDTCSDWADIRMRLKLGKNNPTSKNPEIEKIAGKRPSGNPIQEPWEMDYFCPICGHEMTGEEVEQLDERCDEYSQRFQFSEYNNFMFCPFCNLDIPSFFCLSYDTREKVEMYMKRYLEMIRQIRESVKNEQG